VARITNVVSATEELKTLSEAMIVSGIDETLSEDGPYTFFAPTEDAFSEIGADALVALAADCEDLAYTLRCHIVRGRHMLDDLLDLGLLKSIEGTELYISLGEDDEIYVEEARITRGDIQTGNGVIHLVDLVILPFTGDIVVVDEVAGMVDGNVVGISAGTEGVSAYDYETYRDDDEDDSVAV